MHLRKTSGKTFTELSFLLIQTSLLLVSLRTPSEAFETLLNHQIDLEVQTSGRFAEFQQFSEHNTDGILKNQLKRAAEEDERFRDEELKRKVLDMFRNAQSEVFVRFDQCQSELGSESIDQALENPCTHRETAPLQEQPSPDRNSIISTINGCNSNGQDPLPHTMEPELNQLPATQDISQSESTSLWLPLEEVPPYEGLNATSPREQLNDISQVGDTTDQISRQCFVQSEEEQLGIGTEFANFLVEPSERNSTSAELLFPVELDGLFATLSDLDLPFSFNPDCNE